MSNVIGLSTAQLAGSLVIATVFVGAVWLLLLDPLQERRRPERRRSLPALWEGDDTGSVEIGYLFAALVWVAGFALWLMRRRKPTSDEIEQKRWADFGAAISGGDPKVRIR